MIRSTLFLCALIAGIATGYGIAKLTTPDGRHPITLLFGEPPYSGVCARIDIPVGGSVEHLDLTMTPYGGLSVANGSWQNGATWTNLKDCAL